MTYLISFLTSSNLRIVARDSDGNFKVAYSDNQEKVLALLDKIQKWYNADGTWFWKSVPAAGTEVEFKVWRSAVSAVRQRTDRVPFAELERRACGSEYRYG